MNKTNRITVNSTLIAVSAALLAACGGSGESVNGAQQAASGTACYATWSATQWYGRGSLVSYAGVNYRANHWTQGQNPATNNGSAGSNAPWTSTGACGATPTPAPAPTATPTPAPTPAPTLAPTPSPTPALTPTPAPTQGACGLSNFQQEMLNLVNQARASSRMCGTTLYNAAPPLRWNTSLTDAADGHSLDMATNNYFSHTSLDGRTFAQRIDATGYTWSTAGENIAAGQTTVADVVNGWLNSPGHCSNIMNVSYVDVGVACEKNDSSTYRYYWTMDLAKPR